MLSDPRVTSYKYLYKQLNNSMEVITQYLKLIKCSMYTWITATAMFTLRRKGCKARLFYEELFSDHHSNIALLYSHWLIVVYCTMTVFKLGGQHTF